MGFVISECLVFLAAVYTAFLLLGLWVFKKISNFDPGKTRYHKRLNAIMRFCIYVLIAPLGLTCVLGIFIVYIADVGLF